MRIIACRIGDKDTLGIMKGEDDFIAVADAAPGLPTDVISLLNLPNGLEMLRQILSAGGTSYSINGAKLRPLLDKPNAMWALALNFKTHIKETGLTTSLDHPHLFLRTAASYVGATDDLEAPDPAVARAYDYEGELGVIIGRAGRYIPVDDALSYVAGYTCLNEGSVREFQMHNRQFGLGKNFEASGSYGPWLMTAEEFGDPAEHTVETRVNGVRRQFSSLNDMLFSVPQVISYLSRGYRLRPGDLIAMGTPGALKPAANDIEGQDLTKQYGPFKIPGLVHMKPGDTVEVEISGLGTLRNRVAAAPSTGGRLGAAKFATG
jgi:2-keto-4-pentenoate hydratase/2-oxohepta-3-ene-1,7-dioic acid hydratase in catechol pathway